MSKPAEKTAISVKDDVVEYLWVKNVKEWSDGSWTAYCETPKGNDTTMTSNQRKIWHPFEKPLSELHESRKFEERFPKSGIRKGQIFEVMESAALHPELSKYGEKDDLLIYNVNYLNDTIEIHVNGRDELFIVIAAAELIQYAKPYMSPDTDDHPIVVKAGKRSLGQMLKDFPTTSLVEYMLKGHVSVSVTVYENHKFEGHGRTLFYQEMNKFNVARFSEVNNEKKKCRDLLCDGKKVGLINTTPKTDTALLFAPYTGKVILRMTQQPDGSIDIPMRVKNEITPYLSQTGSHLKPLSDRYETCCNPLFLTLLGMGIWKRAVRPVPSPDVAVPQA